MKKIINITRRLQQPIQSYIWNYKWLPTDELFYIYIYNINEGLLALRFSQEKLTLYLRVYCFRNNQRYWKIITANEHCFQANWLQIIKMITLCDRKNKLLFNFDQQKLGEINSSVFNNDHISTIVEIVCSVNICTDW